MSSLLLFSHDSWIHACLFDIMWVETGSTPEVIVLHIEIRCCLKENNLCNFWITNSNHCFFHGTPFLLGRMSVKLWLFRLEYLSDIFLEMKKMSLSFQGKHLTALLACDKIWAFRWKFVILENLCLSLWAWQLPKVQILQIISDINEMWF